MAVERIDDGFRAVLERTTRDRLAHRIVEINQTTRDRIAGLTIDAVDAGMSPAEFGRALRGVVRPLARDVNAWIPVLRGARSSFASELRAETIARTEMRVAQNAAALDAYGSSGVTKVEMIDGDKDEACARRDGQVVSLEQAEAEMMAEHPNGTLDFAPVTSLSKPSAPKTVTPKVTPSAAQSQPIKLPEEAPAPRDWSKADMDEVESYVRDGDLNSLDEVTRSRYGVRMETEGDLTAPLTGPKMTLKEQMEGTKYVHPALQPGARVDVVRGLEQYRAIGKRPGDFVDRFVWTTERTPHTLQSGWTPAYFTTGTRTVTIAPDSFGAAGYLTTATGDVRYGYSWFEGTVRHETAHALHDTISADLKAEWFRIHTSSIPGVAERIAKDLRSIRRDLKAQRKVLANLRALPPEEFDTWAVTRIGRTEEVITRLEEHERKLVDLKDSQLAEEFPSMYGSNNEYEDFAVSMERWFATHSWFDKHSPSRGRFMDGLLGAR